LDFWFENITSGNPADHSYKSPLASIVLSNNSALANDKFTENMALKLSGV
jgi:hypothetical protein